MSLRAFARIACAASVCFVTACQNGGAALGEEASGLQKIADAYKRFHDDTGMWPMGSTAWDWKTSIQIDPAALEDSDTALFVQPSTLQHCGEGVSKPCWNGPYLSGKSLADAQYLDNWGHRRFATLVRPSDGLGGGTASAPDGIVVIWSAGADGVDGFGCSDASCARNWEAIGHGVPSMPKADDQVLVLARFVMHSRRKRGEAR